MSFDLKSNQDATLAGHLHDGVPSATPYIAPAGLPLIQVCRMVRDVVQQVMELLGERELQRRDRRRMLCHVQQVSMYVCHVALSIPMTEIGRAFGRDRTTVSHSCRRIEDRRDSEPFDAFVCCIEKIVSTVFVPAEAKAAGDRS
ncbi:helix-turn-helix domain-containing protein [Rhizobium sp. SSA_523]|uniref:helix-turn-helix domain-containing protein n=1 Tax=Rhizobium sp. SSA_523 TaxID=2952477 RepID=UPI0020905A2C|nr:helix-turn-helix domain-containing protein [Rhizobium sp. SSA_523]MCO5731933.1 transposase [Rhizobium sp. SSA_523]WKC22715.1 helix-turn-helix domain-containing protein [Rhizobium sp. SSA_523]